MPGAGGKERGGDDRPAKQASFSDVSIHKGTKITSMRRVPLAVAGLVLTLAALWGAAGRAPLALSPLVWFAALWLPGAPFALTGRGPARFDSLWLPLALGPVVFGAGVCAGRFAGLPLPTAAFLTVAASYLAWLAVLVSPRSEAPAAPGSPAPGGPWLGPLLAGAAIFTLGILPPLLHAPLRVRDDALLHLPIIQRILAGSFPPENPFLAGTPLPYFWFYHAVMAGVDRLSGIPLPLSLTLLNVQALAVLLLALDRLARRLGLGPTARAATLLLFGLGLSPWGWGRLLVIRATHPELNWALVKTYGIAGLLPLLNRIDPRLAGSLTKIAVSNAFPMSLALFALAATPPARTGSPVWIRRGILVAGCALFHLVTGFLLIAGLGLAWLVSRLAPDDESGPSARFAALLALAAALIVTVPYAIEVIGARTGESATTLVFQPDRALKLHLALIGIWLLALPALVTWARRGLGRAWLAVGAPALVLPFAVHLIDGNEYKSIFLLLVLLAPAAGEGLRRITGGRRWVMGLVVAAFVPTAWLAAQGYVSDTPPGVLSPAERGRLEAAAAALPSDAVLWRIDPGRDYSAFTFPLGHPMFVSDPYALRILGVWNSEEARWRRGDLKAAEEGKLPEALAAARDRLDGRPLAVLVSDDDARRYPWLPAGVRRLGLREAARAPGLTLFVPPARGRGRGLPGSPGRTGAGSGDPPGSAPNR